MQEPGENQQLGQLTSESRNPLSMNIDRLPTLEAVRLMNAEDMRVASAVETELPHIAKAVDLIASRLEAGGRLIYVGAGSSGRLGVLDAAECPPLYGIEPGIVIGLMAGGEKAFAESFEEVEDDEDAGAADILKEKISSKDIVVGIAVSGRTPYVLGALKQANDLGAATIGITNNRPSAMDHLVQILIAPVVGPEVILGSTRLKSGTAVKMVLNMLSTLTMVKLGKTYGNLMVNLRPGSHKLTDRGRRIITMATGASPEAAKHALAICGNSVKVAIVMLKGGVSPQEAQSLLDRANGFVRKALKLAGVSGEG